MDSTGTVTPRSFDARRLGRTYDTQAVQAQRARRSSWERSREAASWTWAADRDI